MLQKLDWDLNEIGKALWVAANHIWLINVSVQLKIT